MATTLSPIHVLKVGLRDTTGAVVASAKIRFYQPGTTTTQTVYSDDAATTALSQPVTANAAGQADVYTLEAVRMVAKTSDEATTIYDGNVNLVRHDHVYVTSSGINSGNEQTLEATLSDATTSLGSAFKYKESSGATARNYIDWMGQLVVSVVDFNADTAGVTDATTAIQAASDRVEARGGGYVYFPKGTYRISSVLTIDTAGVSWIGAGRAISIIKNYSTTGNSLNVNLGSAVDSKLRISDLSFTCDTTSSGTAINATNGDRIVMERVSVALHRTGISVSGVSDAKLTECIVESTDDNSAAVGIALGARGRAIDCEIISGTTNGTGVNNASAADAKVVGSYISKFATGITIGGAGSAVSDTRIVDATTAVTASGAQASVKACRITGATTGITLSGAAAVAESNSITATTTGITQSGAGASTIANYISSATTGINMTAADTGADRNRLDTCTTGIATSNVANLRIVNNSFTGTTTNVSVNASVTTHWEAANDVMRETMPRVTKETNANGGAITFTPTTNTSVYVMEFSAATGVTIANTATTTLIDGQKLLLVLANTNGSGSATVAYGTQYLGGDTTALTNNQNVTQMFIWRSSTSKWISQHTSKVTVGNTGW